MIRAGSGTGGVDAEIFLLGQASFVNNSRGKSNFNGDASPTFFSPER